MHHANVELRGRETARFQRADALFDLHPLVAPPLRRLAEPVIKALLRLDQGSIKALLRLYGGFRAPR